MDQAIGIMVLCCGISAALIGIVSLPIVHLPMALWASAIQTIAGIPAICGINQWHHWRRLAPHLPDEARRPIFPAPGQASLEDKEREADALMQAHP